ncbi:MAG: AbrB/MazE/SpoVT family DNA-binding domain-containing protein [Oricola sp.]
MRVTEKGQVTIPKAIREKLGIVPGSEVDFVEEGNAVRLVRREAQLRDGESFLRALDRLANSIDLGGISTDEYMLLIRGPRDDLVDH